MTSLKLLFIDNTVPNKKILTDNISNTVRIVDKKESLDIDLKQVEQIGFIWKNEWRGMNEPHFPKFTYFENDTKKHRTNKKISEIVKNLPNLKYIDLITCDLSENSEWKNEFINLKQSTNAEIRYSTNKTGSNTLSADWILEVGKVSVLDEYYDGKDIQYNNHLAPSPIQSFSDFYTIYGPSPGSNKVSYSSSNNVLTFTSDIEIDVDSYPTITPTIWAPVQIDSTIKIIDGGNHKITFKNSSNTIASLFYKPTTNTDNLEIKDLIIDSDNYRDFDGIVYSDNNDPANKITVTNCGVHILYPSFSKGLIFGMSAGSNSGSVIADRCYSTSTIVTLFSGGGCIFGEYAGDTGGSATAKECYMTGNINENYGGGIFGNNAGSNGGTVSAISCYISGNITNNYGGGIFGINAGLSGTVSAISCYATGNITTNGDYNNEEGAGFIFGSYAGYGINSTVSATECYTTGNITTNNYGGFIFADYAGSYGGKVSAVSCYTTGNISTNNYGGCIFGSSASEDSGDAYAIACYTSSNIYNNGNIQNSDYGGGFIFGSWASNGTSSNAYAISCYTTGSITNVNFTGAFIFGSWSENAYAIACYTTGSINVNENGGFIFGSDAGYNNNTYAIACYTTGNIKVNNTGGFIYGKNAGFNGKASAIACYTIGNIETNTDGSFIFGADAANAYVNSCYSTGTINTNTNNGFIFGTNSISVISSASYYINLDVNKYKWYDYNNNNPIVLDPNSINKLIFNYDKNKILKEQLNIRFFSALPWNPLSPDKQKPILLDWSIYQPKIIDIFNDIWYIDYNNNNLVTVIASNDIQSLLKNVRNPAKSLENYTLFKSSSYAPITEFPIIPVIINNNLVNPFILNFEKMEYYTSAFNFWKKILNGVTYMTDMISNDITMPTFEIINNTKMNFINQQYVSPLNYPFEIGPHDMIQITFLLLANINNYELQLNELQDVSIYLSVANEDGLYKLTNIDTQIIRKARSSIMLVASFNMNDINEEHISFITEIRYSMKINPISVLTKSYINSESYKYTTSSGYIILSKLE